MAIYRMSVKHVYRVTQGGVLDEAVASTWTDGSNISFEHVVDFDPDGGTGVFEPGTAREESFEYGGIDEATSQITGVVRPNTLFAHAAGTFVQAEATAVSEMMADGQLEDEESPVVGIPVPPEFEFHFTAGTYDSETRPVVFVEIDEDNDILRVASAPIGQSAVLRTDATDGVEVDSKENRVVVGKGATWELQDVAGSTPPGRAGYVTIWFDSTGTSGIYGRNGTGAVTLIQGM